jgi:hypothetical protein
MSNLNETAEQKRLNEAREQKVPWKKWGPYLSERQWGTVREDYSDNGDAWSYFSHDQARSRAYHWGEDGLAGFSDDKQQLCFALALWNGRDPIIKERLFGLTNSEANHGEDVKEYYFYLDSTPTHSYMRWLYKYPQGAYPYGDLVATNRRRSHNEFEYELMDTGVFNDDRYFDVYVEYAKEAPEEILIRISVANRGPEPATLHVLPSLWFRNTWTWWPDAPKPVLRQVQGPTGTRIISAESAQLGNRWLYVDGEVPLLFTENETNNERIFGKANASPYVKDGINNYLVHGNSGAVNAAGTGTKAAAHHQLSVHGVDLIQASGRQVRNVEWLHMINDHVISMPDKWEYPWYAAWDLAFHAVALSTVDVDFAKRQLELMLREVYLHSSGQIPAYEWNFSDVNPPVHAWATIFLHRTEEALRGEADLAFLRRAFGKLMLNFTWWVNRKDRFGKGVFEGGFLGLDNIGVFDRSAPLPTGGYLEQADGTAWMALFSQNMLEIGIELAAHDSEYDDLAAKFADHCLLIAQAMNRVGAAGLWDEEDGFYYDVLRFPDGTATRLKVRSMVGLLPVCATTVIEPWQREQIPHLLALFAQRLRRMPWLFNSIHPTGPGHFGVAGRGITALVGPDRLRRILSRMLDESEFLSPYGIRAISRYHAEHPYVFRVQGEEYRVDYLPAESNTGMFGGNSNWRGPIWMPVNVMLIRALLQFYLYHGDNFKVECPTGSGNLMNLFEVSREISTRLERIFLRDERGRRPVYGGIEKFQTDPHWRDHLLFYEYFHGDNGAGLGASHQTGWTGLVGKLIQLYGYLDPKKMLEAGRAAAFVRQDRV